MGLTLQENSRAVWTQNDPEERRSTATLKLGAILRIAEATEKMAQNFTALQNDRDYYKRRVEDLYSQNKKLSRRIIALRGAITRKNNQQS